jgi:AcrR family transcriptional regulator
MTHDKEKTRRSIGAKRNPESAEAILSAAKAELLEKGYGGFSIEAVARRAHAGKPTIYRWWANKAALLLDVYDRQKRDIVYADTGSIEEDLFLFLKSLFRYWRETGGGNIFRSFIAEAQSDGAAADALVAYSLERQRRMAAMVQRAKERGEVAEEIDPAIVAKLVTSYAWTCLLTRQIEDDDAAMRAAVRCIVQGILPESARAEK